MDSLKNTNFKKNHSIKVIVPGGKSATQLGVVRGFGRRNIPVVYIDLEEQSIARHSKYIHKRLKCLGLMVSDDNFINLLLNLGEKSNNKMAIIPTGDLDALAISKYKKELEQFYHIPIPEYNIAKNMVNKNNFYKLLEKLNVDYPNTLIPKNLDELEFLKSKMPFPYIIKPSNSILFQDEFAQKCFVLNSQQEFRKAIEKLKNKNLDVMIQEIIPGNDIYAISMYFNKDSKPLAICGYDKLRHFPPDFGNGSFCKTAWRSVPIDIAVQLLTSIGYHGIAEPEFKKDPRDGKYKLLEINVRTSLQNRLPAGSGHDIEYIAYLDVTRQNIGDLSLPDSGIEWVHDPYDFLSCLRQIKDSRLEIKDMLKSFKGKKIHSVVAIDDPIPLFIHMIGMFRRKLKTII